MASLTARPGEAAPVQRARAVPSATRRSGFAGTLRSELTKIRFIGIVVLLGIAGLLIAFRSVAIPLTAAVLNLLSIGAALGVVVAVFQRGWTGLSTTRPVNFAVPVMTFAIVFGLSTDYQVFLLSRIQEEWNAHRDNAQAVHDGMTRVSGIITGAAVIMIAVFASFVASGQLLLEQIGTGSRSPSPSTRS